MSTETDLTEEQITSARMVIAQTPAIALPRGGMGFGRNPETVEHLIEIMDSMAAELRRSLRSEQKALDQWNAHQRKLKLVGGFVRDLYRAGDTTDSAMEG